MGNTLVVGTGNPGEEYINSRSNVGFFFLDYLSKILHLEFNNEKKKSLYAVKSVGEDTVIYLKPQTFTVHSGEAVLYLASSYKIHVKDIYVIFPHALKNIGEMEFFSYEEVEKDQKTICKAVQSMIHSLNTCEFNAIGIGIGPKKEAVEVKDFGSVPLSSEEFKILNKVFPSVYKFLSKCIPSLR